MSAPKRRERPHKDQASVAASGPSRASFQSGDNELSAPPGGPNNPEGPSNPAPSSAPSQVPQVPRYTEDDLQRILKTVLEVCASTRGQDRGTSEDPPEWALKTRVPDIYKGKSHMDCYNFIQQCEDYFAISGSRGRNQVLFAATFLKERALNRWQQHKRKIEAKTLVPLTWAEFKVFLQKSLGGTQVFVDNIWRKFRSTRQYQLEDVMDWSAHMEHLQSVLKEFDNAAAPTDNLLIRYFRDGMRPSIRAQMDERNRDLDDWQAVVERAVDAEAKAARQAPSLARESDARCPRGHRPLHNEEKDQKDSEAKKPDPSANSNSGSGKGGQSGQALGRSSKKDSRSNKGGQRGQSFNK